jgi:hypothetical protein
MRKPLRFIVSRTYEPNINAVHTVFALPGVTFNHLATGFEARESHVRNRVLLMVSLLGGDYRSKSGKREVNTRETETTHK